MEIGDDFIGFESEEETDQIQGENQNQIDNDKQLQEAHSQKKVLNKAKATLNLLKNKQSTVKAIPITSITSVEKDMVSEKGSNEKRTRERSSSNNDADELNDLRNIIRKRRKSNEPLVQQDSAPLPLPLENGNNDGYNRRGKPKDSNSDINSSTSNSMRGGEWEQNQRNAGYLSLDPLTPLPIPPWTPETRIYSWHPVTQLDEEIGDFMKFISPTKGETEMRLFTLSRLRNQLKKLWPSAELESFGSFVTGLYIPSSDLDCIVLVQGVYTPDCLYRLRDQLVQSNLCLEPPTVLPNTKVPIIKYIDNITRFRLDISFNKVNGLNAAKVVKELLRDGGEIVRILMILVKQFLASRMLNEVFSGGMSSFSLLVMIVSFLKLHPRIQTGEIDPLKNTGLLLLEFLDLYAISFNHQTISINASPLPLYTRRRNVARPGVISVIDPTDLTNDLSMGSFNYMVVKSNFGKAFRILTSMIGKCMEKVARGSWSGERIHQGSKTMVTFLGSMVTIDRKILEQRQWVENVYEWYMQGEITLETRDLDELQGVIPTSGGRKQRRGLNGNGTPTVRHKRRRGGGEESKQVVYTDQSSNDDGDESSVDIQGFYKSNTGKIGREEIEGWDNSEKRPRKKARRE